MNSTKHAKVISQILVVLSFIICCAVPFSGKLPGVIIPLSLINILSGDGKLTVNEHNSYVSTLFCFLLPIVFSFVIWNAKYKTTRVVALFLMLPLLMGIPMTPVAIVYFVFSIAQIILWWTFKEKESQEAFHKGLSADDNN